MRAQEPDTWDQKQARAVRRFFQRLVGRMPGFEEWERYKLEALEIEALEREIRRRDSAIAALVGSRRAEY